VRFALGRRPRQALAHLHDALIAHSGDKFDDGIAAIAILRTA